MDHAILKSFFINGPTGLIICEADGRIIEINEAAAAILRAQFPPGIEDNILKNFDDDCRNQIRSLLNIPPDASAQSRHVILCGRSSAETYIRIDAQPFRDSSIDKKLVFLSLIDVSRESKELSETRMSEEKYRALVNFSGDAIVVFDFDSRVVEANVRAMSLFGYTKREFVGKRIDELYQGDLLQRHRAVYDEIRCNGSFMVDTSYIATRDQKMIPVNISGSVVEYGNKHLVQMIFRDITEQLKLQKELISISDRERLIVSQELHDGIGQVLTGMSYLIEKLIRRMRGKNTSEMKTLHDIHELARDALDKTRNITHGLVPVFANEEAMISSIMRLADDARRMFGVNVLLDLDGMPRGLSRDEMTQLYYIIKESLHNSVKHGSPKTIKVKWVADNGSYELSVRDDGLKGVLVPGRTGGMGMNIMKYRAGLIGAHLFSGFEGNGFMVKITKM